MLQLNPSLSGIGKKRLNPAELVTITYLCAESPARGCLLQTVLLQVSHSSW